MLRTSIATHAPVSGELLPVIADDCVVWSSGRTTWDGLIVERHRFDQLDTPEFEFPDVTLLIHLSPPVTVEHQSNGRVRRRLMTPGEIGLLPSGTPRQVRIRGQCDLLILALSSELVNRAAREAHVAANAGLIEHQQLRDAQLAYIGMALKAEAEAGYQSGRLYGEALGMALAVHLLAKYSVTKPFAGERRGGMSPRCLRRVVEYIHDNLAENMRLCALAEVAGLSLHRFAHNFKQATGLAPHQYVIRARLEQAKRLLRETDLTIQAIAYALGFGSHSRFTLLFRRATGVTPSVYRVSCK